MRWPAAMAAACLLAGCAAPGGPVPSGEAERLQGAREARVGSYERWALNGRIAVSDGKDGGSARVRWEAEGEVYDLWIYAPLAQGTWRLRGNAGEAVLEGSGGTWRDEDPALLLARHLGWHLPVNAMRHWARGLRAPGVPARLSYDHRGRPQELEQAGWTVRYTDWVEYPGLILPRRIEAESPPYSVRLVVQGWAMSGADGDQAPAP